jgi:hypothetical protein
VTFIKNKKKTQRTPKIHPKDRIVSKRPHATFMKNKKKSKRTLFDILYGEIVKSLEINVALLLFKPINNF